MIAEIMKEKISADHLLYVSLKYTKTCDVILNLISRWQSMIEISFDALLEKAVKIIEGTSRSMGIEIVEKIKKETVEEDGKET